MFLTFEAAYGLRCLPSDNLLWPTLYIYFWGQVFFLKITGVLHHSNVFFWLVEMKKKVLGMFQEIHIWSKLPLPNFRKLPPLEVPSNNSPVNTRNGKVAASTPGVASSTYALHIITSIWIKRGINQVFGGAKSACWFMGSSFIIIHLLAPRKII
jgi:hypothetical protein